MFFFPIQDFNFGVYGDPETYHNQLLLDAQTLGGAIEYMGRIYRLVQLQGATAAAAGGVVYWKTRSQGIVSTAHGDSDSVVNGVAGVFPSTASSGAAGFILNDYCFIQIGGVAPAAKVSASTAAGDKMIGSATDLTFGRIAAGTAATDNVFGTAIGAIAGGVAPVALAFGNLL